MESPFFIRPKGQNILFGGVGVSFANNAVSLAARLRDKAADHQKDNKQRSPHGEYLSPKVRADYARTATTCTCNGTSWLLK